MLYNSGGSSTGSGNLTFDGTNLTCGGNITAYSDITLKDNIAVIENALQKLEQLRGITFSRKGGGNKRYAGVVAQELQSVMPELVETDKRGILSVAYGNITSLLIEAIKELKTEIDVLKGK